MSRGLELQDIILEAVLPMDAEVEHLQVKALVALLPVRLKILDVAGEFLLQMDCPIAQLNERLKLYLKQHLQSALLVQVARLASIPLIHRQKGAQLVAPGKALLTVLTVLGGVLPLLSRSSG